MNFGNSRRVALFLFFYSRTTVFDHPFIDWTAFVERFSFFGISEKIIISTFQQNKMVQTRGQVIKEETYKASKKCTVIGDRPPLAALPVPRKKIVNSICTYQSRYNKKCRNYTTSGSVFCHPHMNMDKTKRDRNMRIALKIQEDDPLGFPDRPCVQTILPPPIGVEASEWKPRIFEWKTCDVCKTHRLEDGNGCKTCRLWRRLTCHPEQIQPEPESPELVWESMVADNFKAIRSPIPQSFTQDETIVASSMLQLGECAVV